MATRALTAELQEELLDLLRHGTISQGQVARLLGITRWDVLDLMAKHGVPSGPESAEEMRREIDNARRVASRP